MSDEGSSDDGSRRWPELTDDKDTYNTTLHCILNHQGHVCLFCRKNRSFVTATPIYISSPHISPVVTNVPGFTSWSVYSKLVVSFVLRTRSPSIEIEPRNSISKTIGTPVDSSQMLCIIGLETDTRTRTGSGEIIMC